MQTTKCKHKCPLCFVECAIHSELMKHYIKSHKNDERFEIKCAECNYAFKKLRSFQQHLLRKHPNNGTANVEQVYEVPEYTHHIVDLDDHRDDLVNKNNFKGYKCFLQ